MYRDLWSSTYASPQVKARRLHTSRHPYPDPCEDQESSSIIPTITTTFNFLTSVGSLYSKGRAQETRETISNHTFLELRLAVYNKVLDKPNSFNPRLYKDSADDAACKNIKI